MKILSKNRQVCLSPPPTYDEHHPHVMHAMQKNIKTWGIKAQEGKVKTLDNMKLSRTLSMVRQTHKNKQKENEITLLAIELGIHLDPIKNLVVCPLL